MALSAAPSVRAVSSVPQHVRGEPRAPTAPTAAPGPLAGTAALALGLHACQRMRRRATLSAVATATLKESSADVAERRRLQELVSKWRADDAEAWASLALTATLYVGSLAVLHLSGGHWAAIILLAFALVRAFIVFHDAAHSSFFEKPEHNKTLGQVLQFFINYSLDEWNTVHNSHHAHFGDVTVKDSSLTIWFSEKELENAPWYLWLAHRIIRDPIFFLSISWALCVLPQQARPALPIPNPCSFPCLVLSWYADPLRILLSSLARWILRCRLLSLATPLQFTVPCPR